MLSIDDFGLVEKTMQPIGEYFFTSFNKAIINGRLKKRKLDQPPNTHAKQVMVWNASNIKDEEFVDEVVDVIGAYVSTNKWSVSNLKKLPSQQRKQIS